MSVTSVLSTTIHKSNHIGLNRQIRAQPHNDSWGRGTSGRIPTLQAQGLKFKPQYHPKQTKQKTHAKIIGQLFKE